MEPSKKHIITLGGLPGSGKSTVKRILAERLGYKTFSTGDFTRDLALSKGMTLEAFNELVATDKSLDLLIDEELLRIEREDDKYVIDSHLAFHFVQSGFSVYLDIPLETAIARVYGDRGSHVRIKAGDTAETLEEVARKTTKRIDNHRDRYVRHYNVDPYIKEQYEYIADSEHQNPEEVSAAILVAYENWLKN
jgi:CMP/dCMP kinase